MLSSTVSPLSVSTSQCSVCCFCVNVSTAVFYSLSTVCQYLTTYRLFFLCVYVHCCLLQPLQRLSVPHNMLSVLSLSLCPLLYSTVSPLSVSTPHCTVCWFCVTMSTGFLLSVHCLLVPQIVLFVLSVSVCPIFSATACRLFVPHIVPSVGPLSLYPFCLLHYLHWLSVPHTETSVSSVSQCPL